MKQFYLIIFLLVSTLSFAQNDSSIESKKLSAENNSRETISLNDIQLYPNPVTNNTFTIKTTIVLNYRIYDVLGKKIQEGVVDPQNKTVNIYAIKKGVYIIKLDSKNKSVTKKLIKQ